MVRLSKSTKLKTKHISKKKAPKLRKIKDSERRLGNKRPKRLRRSSLIDAQKNFAVFGRDDEHYNKYENLQLDLSDSEETLKAFKDNSLDHNIFEDIPVVETITSSDEESSNQDIQAHEQNKAFSLNQLENNEDFIAFDSSSEGEDNKIAHDESDTDINIPTSNAIESDNESCETNGRGQNRISHAEHPWLLQHDHSKQNEVSDLLTEEIKDFVAYISPSREEIELRNQTIGKIRKAVKKLWKNSDLYVFGSYATDLYLPGSDIDCVIISSAGDKENRHSLYQLSSWLKQNKLATKVEVIAKARVPIIKFVEPSSNIHIDVSFERSNGLEAAKTIRDWLNSTPGLRELVLIIKQFLNSRRLNDVHLGGLGGLSIICMVYSFLSLHPRILTNDIDPLDNLGVLLLDFFELYGKNFAYDDVALSFQDGRAAYMPKKQWRDILPVRTTYALAIQDPNDPTNNISRSSYNLRDIRRAFTGAFDMITNKCFEMDAATFKDRVGQTILGNVIKYRGRGRNFRDDRELVVNNAIIENEAYHRKRSRIVHTHIVDSDSDEEIHISDDDVFIQPSSEEEIDLKDEKELYNIIYSPLKKPDVPVQKKVMKLNDAKTVKKEHPTKKLNSSGRQRKNPSINVDEMMGLNAEDDSDDSNDSITMLEHIKISDEESSDNTTPEVPITPRTEEVDVSSKTTVNAQTRREYWLSKGQVASPQVVEDIF
ncbi:hypothetical protein TBLA_0A07840 [Henningerozyma blattae CBS 6284]|uniref:polynucleotide adenylyltransferase n=1 Tax=Henningerozyma blattae (strain ATCC 34711 / CBS 6284 / DSM 70876 / NBRC 10599 / NRRL Y-10934 / UCD 77-7) TaxID=1071380 RepID=I2GWS1_HENB6|nr:hypothetical protein TBLA_0A07840 [Tetrapisispora blattae CBS 6284]CCH58573.1 hypothetical protein TBLA_0A07840 [Tetrapisispora blattae CBS 6284]